MLVLCEAYLSRVCTCRFTQDLSRLCTSFATCLGYARRYLSRVYTSFVTCASARQRRCWALACGMRVVRASMLARL